jgi:hypothetical protein
MPVVKADVHAPIFCFPKILKYKTMSQEVYTDYEVKKDLIGDDHLFNWVFHFNPHTSLWTAIPRDLYTDYWSNYDIKGVLRSKSINTILELLQRSKGDLDLIDQITSSDIKK